MDYFAGLDGYPKPVTEMFAPPCTRPPMLCLRARWRDRRSNLALPGRRYKVSLRGGMRLMRTKGRRRAVVAVARKLAVLLHRMWADGTEFRPAKVEGLA